MGQEWMFNPFFVISSKIDLIKTLDEDSTKNLHKFIVRFMKTNSEFRFDILANVLIWKKYNILEWNEVILENIHKDCWDLLLDVVLCVDHLLAP